MIEIKALSYFQGNPQSSVHKPNFWNSFTKQTQQFQCTSNVKLSRKETKKAKKEQENRHNWSCTSRERTVNNNTKTEQKNLKIWCPPLDPTQYKWTTIQLTPWVSIMSKKKKKIPQKDKTPNKLNCIALAYVHRTQG